MVVAPADAYLESMAPLHAGRFAARLQGDFVVFYIGMRINNFAAVHKWLPVSMAMPRMIQELLAQPELGLLHAEPAIASLRMPALVQYWRSFDHLNAYAHARDKAHLPAWAAFNKAARGNTAVGVFHETYLIQAGNSESVYVNMPPFGMGRAGELVPAVGSMHNAAQRVSREMRNEDNTPSG